MEWQFFVELVTNGILTGLMYSLVAVGFVLIYKSTDAINFAQGEFCMIAAIIIAGFMKLYGFPLFGAIAVGLFSMLVFNWGLERVVLRPMIGRPVVAIIMATIGLALMFRGLGPLVFGAETRPIGLPIPDQPIIWGPFFMSPIDLLGGGISLAFMAVFGWFFMKSRKGVAMRAVADSHQISMAMGINVERYFALAWMLAGFVALLGGPGLGQRHRGRYAARGTWPEGFPGGHIGRPGFDRRGHCRGRYHRRGRGHIRRLCRSLCGRRHQGFHAVCIDDSRADGSTVRDIRQANHRTYLTPGKYG